MERRVIATCSRRAASKTLRAMLLSGASAAVLLAGLPATAQIAADERVYRAEALAHAGAVESAWRNLETWILDRSPGPPGWSGAVPPAAAGWQGGWTERGLEARYCDDVLLVYLAPERLKGVGRDHRAVHAAPHAYGGGEKPVLHWLEGGAAQGGVGRASVALPACLTEGAQGGPLPSGRAALAGTVRDPFAHTVERVTRERREEACPAGQHGEGRTLVREVTRTQNGRGDPVGEPAEGPWEVLIDLCRADYSRWEHYTLVCHWDAGPPHNRRMEGREVWRRLRTATAAGETLGPPEFVSTSCWTGDALPPPPTPEISETARVETRSGGCPAGYTGSIGYERTVTLRSTRFPWDQAPVTQTIYGAWTLARDGCVVVPEPDVDEPDHDDPDDPDVGGPDQSDPDGPDTGGPDKSDPGGPDVGGPDIHGDPGGPDHGYDGGPDYGDHSGPVDGHDGGHGHGDPGGPDGGPGGGSSGPGGDSCGGTDAGQSAPGDGVCSADGIGGIGDSGGGDGGGAGDGGGCFLTTAVVERRGEADDGPTLTLLREFRDAYMTRTPERRALVEEYYAIAPKLVAAIPADHDEWERIARAVDSAADAIGDGAEDGAFDIYVALVRRLTEDWGAAAGIGRGRPAADRGGRP